MSDKTRYEKELAQALKNLPLPSEDAAWDDMSKLLDEENDKVPPPPLPFYRNNIFMGSIIGALLIGALLLFIFNKKSTDNTQVNDQTNKSTQLNSNNKSRNKELLNTNNDQKNLNSTNNHTATNTATNSPAIASNGSSKSGNKELSNTNDKQKDLNSSNDQTITNTVTDNPATVNSGSSKNINTNAKQPIVISNNGTAKQITVNSQTNTGSKNSTAVLPAATVNTNGSNNLSNNNNHVKVNQINNKETVTTNKAIYNNTTSSNNNTQADNITVSGKKVSNKNIKNSSNNTTDVTSSSVTTVPPGNSNNTIVSTSVATASAVSSSAKHKKNHTTAFKSSGKTTTNIKSATQNNDAAIPVDTTTIRNDITTTDQSATNTTVATKNTAVVRSSPVKHSAKLPHYDQSTAAVTTTAKSSKHGYHKKTTTAAATKANTHIKITSAATEENNDVIDTTELIKIGQSVLANKKAKHPPVIKKDTSAAKPLVAAIKDSTNKKKEKESHIAVGIAEQQAIRLSCDCVYPNDAYTKSSLATDYIPSVYVRVYPTKKWFVEAELKYKAPQYIQEQLYKSTISDQPLDYRTSTYVLKKVYYNQIPVSLNYYIIPHLSIGAGVIYNNFAGQTTQQDIAKKLYGSSGGGDSIISSSIINNKSNDSGITFTKNSFQALLQSQYDWRRWSIGIRYAIGLQPYVKYKDSISGAPIEKTSNALTVFIRFELWDSKKKKKK